MNPVDDLLTIDDAEEGERVKVQDAGTDQIHDAVVDSFGVVRTPDNGAAFNKHNYMVVKRGE